MDFLPSSHLLKWKKNLNKRKIFTKRRNYLQACEGVDMSNLNTNKNYKHKHHRHSNNNNTTNNQTHINNTNTTNKQIPNGNDNNNNNNTKPTATPKYHPPATTKTHKHHRQQQLNHNKNNHNKRTKTNKKYLIQYEGGRSDRKRGPQGTTNGGDETPRMRPTARRGLRRSKTHEVGKNLSATRSRPTS